MKGKEIKIENSLGYKKLYKAIKNDSNSGRDLDERMEKLKFAVSRAKHYEEKTGVSASEILTSWENDRSYWYMNYYQDANQPLIEADTVKVFATQEDLLKSIGKKGFRCPYCHGVSTSPYTCNSGVKVPLMNSKKKELAPCNWNVGGLFGDLGKGIYVFVSEMVSGEKIFKPIAWEIKEAKVKKKETPEESDSYIYKIIHKPTGLYYCSRKGRFGITNLSSKGNHYEDRKRAEKVLAEDCERAFINKAQAKKFNIPLVSSTKYSDSVLCKVEDFEIRKFILKEV